MISETSELIDSIHFQSGCKWKNPKCCVHLYYKQLWSFKSHHSRRYVDFNFKPRESCLYIAPQAKFKIAWMPKVFSYYIFLFLLIACSRRTAVAVRERNVQRKLRKRSCGL